MLRIEGLRVAFGATPAVDGIDLALEAGQTLGIVGESGCGKSLLALSVMRLLPAAARIASGRVLFDGQDLAALPPAAMRQVRGARIGMVFQEPMTSLHPAYTVGAQLEEAIRAHGSPRNLRAQAAAALARVRIAAPERRLDAYPHQLSGGMRQRVMIAMALACRPQLLIADEPTTALDVTVQAQILDLLRELQAQDGMALLLITHDLGVVAEMADRVAVMYAGRVVEDAPAAALFDDPQHPYTLGLLSSIPPLDGIPDRLPAIQGAVPPAGSWPRGCRFRPRCVFGLGICEAVPPPLRPVSLGHTAACIRAPIEALAA